MKVTGIIAEYNPFHNGHKYQIEKIKQSGSAVAVIMSGDFVQRGDTALFDKYARTRCALLCGADIVFELPCVYSLSTAQRFAQGAVSTLDALGIIDYLCFGSESGDISALVNAAEIIENEPECVSEKIKMYILGGMSYPAARQKAFDGIIDGSILSEPNNILALEYIRALNRISSRIKPITVKRHLAGYHNSEAVGGIASASAVRRMISEHIPFDAVVPTSTLPLYKYCAASDRERLFPMLFYALRTNGVQGIKNIAGISEGLENRIYREISNAGSFSELAAAVKTKRYTKTRIDRALMCIILGITDSMTALPPQYIQVLGMNRTGASMLARSKKTRTLPVITKPSAFSCQSVIWERSLFASDIASAAFGKYRFGSALTRSPVFLDI